MFYFFCWFLFTWLVCGSSHSNVLVIVYYVCVIHYSDILWYFIQFLVVRCMYVCVIQIIGVRCM